jgi:hypothetical protein
MSKHPKVTVLGAALAALALAAFAMPALGDRGGRSLKAELSGFEEVPAISSAGSGELLLRIAGDENSIEYVLSYENIGGTATVGAHIHLGQPGVNGGVIVFLCGGSGKPDCTPNSGLVADIITPDDVIGPAGQGIAAGEFDKLIEAIRGGVTYANVHTDIHLGGEIRGRIK